MQHNYDPGSLLKRVGKEGKGEKEEEEKRGRRKEKGGCLTHHMKAPKHR